MSGGENYMDYADALCEAEKKSHPMTEKRECRTCKYGKDGLPTWGFILCERCSRACTCKDNWQPKEDDNEMRDGRAS